jgi:FixJ family two-component response regulator
MRTARHPRNALGEKATSVVSIAEGSHVAAELGISEITVKVYRGCVMRKMHADSLAQLVGFARQLATSGPLS